MQNINQTKLPIILALLSLLPIANALPFRPLGAPITIYLMLFAILNYFLASSPIDKDVFKSLMMLLILTMLASLSLVFSPIEINIDAQFLKKYLKYFFLFLVIPIFSHQIKSVKNVKKILFLLLIGVAIVCIFGIALNYNLHNLKNPINVFWYTSLTQNSFGSWTPAIFLIGLYLLIDKENKYKYLTALLLFIIIVTQILTVSRVGYFMIFISFVIWWAVFLNFKKKIYSLIILMIISYGLIKSFPNESAYAFKRMETLSSIPKFIKAANGRTTNYVKGYDAFINYPILGIGIHNFQNYKNESFDSMKLFGRVNAEDSHSIYIDFFAELGLISGLIILYFLKPIVLYKKRHHNLYGDIYLLTKLCVWLIMLRGLTSDVVLSNPVNILIFAIALYLSRDKIDYEQKFIK